MAPSHARLSPIEHRAPAHGMLALGVEARTLRSCLIDRVGHEHRLLGWINVERSTHVPLTGQIAAVVRRLGLRLGRRLWDDAARGPWLHSEDRAATPPLDHVGVAVAEQTGLRVWTAALTTHGSQQALDHALTATQADVVGRTVLTAALSVPHLAHDLGAARPHVLILCGGYDQAGTDTRAALIRLATIVSQAAVPLPAEHRPTVIYAGNHRLAAAVRELFLLQDSTPQFDVVPNVLPEPGIVQRAELIRLLNEHNWRLVRQMPGMGRLGQWVTSPLQLTSMETAFAQLVQAWRDVHDLASLHGLYVGAEHRLHVWSMRARPDTGLCYMPVDAQAPPQGWPPIRLISGSAQLPSDGPIWWDQTRLAPLIATLGHVAPEAMLQVLTYDVFRRLG